MNRMLLLVVLAGCGRPADEDCWRGPVPIVRECPCSCETDLGAPPADAAAAAPPQGVLYRDAPMEGAVGSNATSDASLCGSPPGGSRPDGPEGGAPDPITLRITQLLIDPTAVPDRDGEWVEVHNPTPLPAPLTGVAIAVNGAPRCVFSDAELPAFGFVLVARTAAGGRFPCPRLSLPNKRGEVALVRDGEVLDVVVWESAPKGEALSGSPPPRRSSPRPPG